MDLEKLTQLIIQSVGPYLGGDGKLDSPAAVDGEKDCLPSEETAGERTMKETEEKVAESVVTDGLLLGSDKESSDQDQPVKSETSSPPPVISPPPARTFNIEFKARHNAAMDRHSTLRQVSTVVQRLDPQSRNIVDYEEPQFTIAVEVLCKTVCVALLKDYKGNKKYNLQMLGGGGEAGANGSGGGGGNAEDFKPDVVKAEEELDTETDDELQVESGVNGEGERKPASASTRDEFGFLNKCIKEETSGDNGS